MAAIAPDLSAAMRTIRALRDEAFDVVHLHEPLAPGPTLTGLIFSEKPLIGTFHRSGESGWVRTFRGLSTWAVKHLAVRVAVSEEARDTARETLGGTYVLLWNGIDVHLYQEAEQWAVDGPTIMFVGRHEPRKGLSVLIDAMKHLGPDVRLWVASEGPETARLRRASAGDDRIEWLGMIDEKEKISRIRGAHVLCAPSLHGESFGVILLEGMAAGTPVVASDLPGYRNVARSGKDALLVPPGDSAALARALETALAGGPDVDELVDHGQERARMFSLSSLAERYVDLYEQAIGR
jgi:phosphatidylinositol alpha-mannosyltransferase